ncbi:SRPBCC family protein [Lentzea sp. BCCO 10_0856]|uniref:SRPBCC family protein n=1 Tax=Lentzea miocenica TaxID=3095431 RepID=A0ABU4T7K1_9PSEU|nr:SRPBCC family protein [Lentzea sp. BCCO 10_0856]MDX8034144.1 SRPBCC family protein [Lentzea sp. BCCO 10_0856]
MTTSFTYASYIRTDPGTLWDMLTDPELTPDYWFDSRVESDWRIGSQVRLVGPDGRLWDHGEVLECAPPRRLSFTWITVMDDFAGEPPSRLSFDIEPVGEDVRLTVTHDGFQPGSALLDSIAEGWPQLVCSLKSLLETGRPLAVSTPDPKYLASPGDGGQAAQ